MGNLLSYIVGVSVIALGTGATVFVFMLAMAGAW